MGRIEAIILSMTPYERDNPNCLNHSRKRRIAAGAGVKVEEINRLLKQFDTMQHHDAAALRPRRQQEDEAHGQDPPAWAASGRLPACNLVRKASLALR